MLLRYISVFFHLVFVSALMATQCLAETSPRFVLTDTEKDYISGLASRPVRLTYSHDVLYGVQPDGTETGTLLPFLNLLRREFNLKVEVRKQHWEDALCSVDSRETDFYGPIAITKGRQQNYYVIDPLMRMDAQIVSRVGDPLGSLLNLEGKKLGLLTRSIMTGMMLNYLYPDGELIRYPSIDAMFDALEKGEVDFVETVDHAEVESFRRPNIWFETTVRDLYVNQGFISRSEDLQPLMAIINRYIASDNGKALKRALQKQREAELLRAARKNLAAEIATLRQRISTVEMFDNGYLYPYSFFENGIHRGLLAEINEVFTSLTGVPVRVSTLGEGQLFSPDLLRTGVYHVASGGYSDVKKVNVPDIAVSPVLWKDNLRFYSYRHQPKTLEKARIGLSVFSEGYLYWDSLYGAEYKVYPTRKQLVDALLEGEIDVIFDSELMLNYYYAALQDYTLQSVGSYSAEAGIRLLYNTENNDLNRLFNVSLQLYQMLHPSGRANWEHLAQEFASERIREQKSKLVLVYTIGAIAAVLGLLFLFSMWRHARFSSQLGVMIRRQKTFDLVWGNLFTRRLTSKGQHPLSRKWGVTVPETTSMDELAEVFKEDVHADFKADMDRMREEGLDYIVTEKTVISPRDAQPKYYLRYLHPLGKHRFMACMQDITDAVLRAKDLTHAATTDFLSTLLTRRAMTDLLIQQCAAMRKSGKQAFVVFIDIDDFKKVNDSYGHDVGDDALRTISRILQSDIAGFHAASRWGGEEFVMLFSDTTLQNVRERVLHIIKAVESERIPILGTDNSISVTVSAGLAELDCSTDYNESVSKADEALYKAKRNGKNCLQVYE